MEVFPVILLVLRFHHRRAKDDHKRSTYRVVNDILGSRIVVNVDGHAAQGRDFGGELVEARVVLALPFVGFGHVGL